MNRGQFLRTAGMGAAALGAATMGMSSVVNATKGIAPPCPTLDAVKARGYLMVGVGAENVGSFFVNGRGIDADLGRALAAAIFATSASSSFNEKTVRFQYSQAWGSRLSQLGNGEFDVLHAVLSWYPGRDTYFDANVVSTYYYAAGLLGGRTGYVPNASTIFGVITGTIAKENIYKYFGTSVTVLEFPDKQAAANALVAGTIQAYGNDATDVQDVMALAGPDFSIIPGYTIYVDPIASAVRSGDDAWYKIVEYVFFAMLQAEQWGWTSKNIQSQFAQRDATDSMGNYKMATDKRIFLGAPIDGYTIGGLLGLRPEWAYNVVRLIGNYAEVYVKHFGGERGPNAPVPKGLMFFPPWGWGVDPNYY